MDNHIYYHHFQDKNKKFTIAGRFGKNQTGSEELVLAIALCSKKDNLCRKIGRTIATGRLNAEGIWQKGNILRTIPRGVHHLTFYSRKDVTTELGITEDTFKQTFPNALGNTGFKEGWFNEDPARLFHGVCVWLSDKSVRDLKDYFRLNQH